MSDDKNQKKGEPEEKHDNVIRFPVERVKSKRKLKKLAGKMGDNKKATLFLSLLSVMIMSAYLLQNMDGQVGRDVASSDVRDMDKEKQLAQDLSNSDQRVPASYGRKPTSEDKFRRQFSGYLIKNHDETRMLENMHLTEGAKPVPVKHLVLDYEGSSQDLLKGFLLYYSDYIHPGYDEVRKYADPEETVLTAHTYDLLRDGEFVGRIRIVLQQSNDEYGPIDSIKVQSDL